MERVRLRLRPQHVRATDIVHGSPLPGAPAEYLVSVVEMTAALEIRHRYEADGQTGEVLYPPSGPKLDVGRIPSYLQTR